MFNCTGCSANPFGFLFPTGNSSLSSFESDLEQQEICILEDQWYSFLHPRAERLYKNVNIIISTLAKKLENIGDPVLQGENCVLWPGDLYNGVPSILIDGEQVSVIKVLVDLFSDDESYNSMHNQKLIMECGSASCINLGHVVLPIESDSQVLQ